MAQIGLELLILLALPLKCWVLDVYHHVCLHLSFSIAPFSLHVCLTVDAQKHLNLASDLVPFILGLPTVLHSEQAQSPHTEDVFK